MYTLENGSRVGEQPPQMLRRLELTVMWLWSDEPVCDIADRPVLLTRLGAASEVVERLAFRHQVDPDEPTDSAALHGCASELETLVQHWRPQPPQESAAATALVA